MARNTNQVIAGVGLLYVAPYGTAAPTNASGALDALFTEVGYTDTGATISTEITSEPLEVAEELDPIAYTTTGRTGTLGFAMAQASARTLSLALNRGAAVSDTSTTVVTPPNLSEEVDVAFILQTDQGARWYFPKARNSGSMELPRAKTGKTLLSVTFNLSTPTSSRMFFAYPNSAGLI